MSKLKFSEPEPDSISGHNFVTITKSDGRYMGDIDLNDKDLYISANNYTQDELEQIVDFLKGKK